MKEDEDCGNTRRTAWDYVKQGVVGRGVVGTWEWGRAEMIKAQQGCKGTRLTLEFGGQGAAWPRPSVPRFPGRWWRKCANQHPLHGNMATLHHGNHASTIATRRHRLGP